MLLFHAPLLAFQMGGAMRPLSAAPPVERAVVSASLTSFHAWLEANKLSTDKVVGKELPGFGLSLVAGERGVRTGDTLVSVPASLHFTPRSIEGTPLGEAVRGVIDDESALLALHLLQEGARGPEGSARESTPEAPPYPPLSYIPIVLSPQCIRRLALPGAFAVERADAGERAHDSADPPLWPARGSTPLLCVSRFHCCGARRSALACCEAATSVAWSRAS